MTDQAHAYPGEYRSAPTAYAALSEYLENNPDHQLHHPHPYDVSRSDIYLEDTWQPIFAEMRAKGPLHYVGDSPFRPHWNVVSHKAIAHVEALPDLFSSSWEYGGITILDRAENVSPEEAFELPMFIAMDRPEHTAQRRTVSPAFTPTEMKRLEESLRRRTGALLDTLPISQQFDWVEKVSIELTTQMLAILFGFPWEDRHLLTYWSDWAGDTELATVRELDKLRQDILREMGSYFGQLWSDRAKGEQGKDLISMMIRSDSMNHMSPQEFIGNLVLLIVGGNDTTRNTMSGIIHAFHEFPEQRIAFENDKTLIPNAVQECIRYQTPLAHMRRTATEDTELFGQRIAKGDKLVLWYLSANRDEEVFENPDVLDIGRENARRHLAFGYGIHRCVGARLAELQLRVLLEEMHKRRLHANVTGKVERTRANFVHGFRKLEVELKRF